MPSREHILYLQENTFYTLKRTHSMSRGREEQPRGTDRERGREREIQGGREGVRDVERETESACARGCIQAPGSRVYNVIPLRYRTCSLKGVQCVLFKGIECGGCIKTPGSNVQNVFSLRDRMYSLEGVHRLFSFKI